jgi:hypothetical protein
MKKKNLKNLNLNKTSITNLSSKTLKGGVVDSTICTIRSVHVFCGIIIKDPTDSLSCWLDSCGCPTVFTCEY